MIVLPDADLEATRRVAERARAAVLALAEPHTGGGDGIVTVSVGVAAAVPTGPPNSEQLLHAADVALYEAKRAGRNRIAEARPD